jgi:hypothetical protein
VERRARAFNAAVKAASARVQQQAEEVQQELMQRLAQVGLRGWWLMGGEAVLVVVAIPLW